ncbi:MarR family winged helix-turn-helix transcriptional regulator [Roseibium sp. SCP14]|uniref:MarR family winged helix-turn-helix transcriptional regulator n=1 Tax=Roseibium sp. SCP14 TaxID=3141375 RepID=UPI00333DD0A7
MSKSDDQNPDHIGWDLWQAAAVWKARFTREMVAKGHDWFGEARGTLLQHLPSDGIRQNALTGLSGMTKQAIQQHLDDLEKDEIVTRENDPDDKRKKRVMLTEKGWQAVRDAAEIKVQIENAYAGTLGRDALKNLKSSLKSIIDLES